MWEVIIAGAAAIKVPGLFAAAARSTGEKLLGPILDSWAQPIKDRSAQRSRLSQAIAEMAAREIGENPDNYRTEIDYLIRRSRLGVERTSATFKKTMEHLADIDVESLPKAEPQPPGDDWLNRWSRYVEDASSEELQDTFARILAGEITKRGSFSISTLRVVAEMSQELAGDFQKMWDSVIDDYAVKYTFYNRGEHWHRLLRLREAGLVSSTDVSIHRPGGQLWGFGVNPHLLVTVDPSTISEVPIINLTRLGRELGSILPPPATEDNLRKLALECPDRRGWKKASLFRNDGGQHFEEVLWASQ